MRLTVGPLPPAVYWRRRALVLGAALLLLFVVAQACMGSAPAGDRSGDGETPSPDPGTSVAPVATGDDETEPPPDGDDDDDDDDDGDGDGENEGEDEQESPEPLDRSICTDDEIRVTALAERETFARGESVQFTIRIEHDADRACNRDVGGRQRELYLVRGSGADHVWSSQVCGTPGDERQVEELTATWSAQHYIEFAGVGGAGCDTDLAPGEYQLHARLGTARSDPVSITLQ